MSDLSAFYGKVGSICIRYPQVSVNHLGLNYLGVVVNVCNILENGDRAVVHGESKISVVIELDA